MIGFHKNKKTKTWSGKNESPLLDEILLTFLTKLFIKGGVNMIKIIRKDGSERLVEIMQDKATGMWCYVNLTSNHVCEKRWPTYNEAMKSIFDETFVKDWKTVEPKPEQYNWTGLFHYLGILLKAMFLIK